MEYHVCSTLLHLCLVAEWGSRERSTKCQADESKALTVGAYTQCSAAVLIGGKRKEGSSLCVHEGQGMEFM